MQLFPVSFSILVRVITSLLPFVSSTYCNVHRHAAVLMDCVSMHLFQWRKKKNRASGNPWVAQFNRSNVFNAPISKLILTRAHSKSSTLPERSLTSHVRERWSIDPTATTSISALLKNVSFLSINHEEEGEEGG